MQKVPLSNENQLNLKKAKTFGGWRGVRKGSKEAGRVDKQNPTNSDKLKALIMQELAAISQDVAQKLIDSMPNCRVVEKEGSMLQILTLSISLM